MFMFRLAGAATLATAALAGCAQKPPPPPPPPPLPPHLGPPPAAACTVAPFTLPDGGTATITLSVVNDGGYCAATLTASGGRPFDAPLLPVPPAHGQLRIVKYNGRTSIEYVPAPRYAGPDQATVRLIQRGRPGYTTAQLRITVTAGVPRG